jgi:GNAT superfamily N-acetyltransferase
MRLTQARTPSEVAAFCSLPAATTLTPDTPSVGQADAHWLAVDDGGAPLARCSLWWNHAPSLPAARLGLIGHYAAHDDAAAGLLLAHARAHLAAQGCTLAVGPLDGNTFRHYRFVTNRAVDGVPRPPFFLEPDNPDAWPLQFAAAGFAPSARYFSAIGPLPQADSRLDSLAARVQDAGIHVRPASLDAFDAELNAIYTVTAQSFTHNFLYTPIERDEFLAQYGPIRPYAQPEFVLIAEQAGEPVGFLFAVPDLAQARRGEPVTTLIAKTTAVLPDLGGHGLASYMLARVQMAARELGYTHVIHALMHENNHSRKISAHYAAIMRQYTLFAAQL